TTRGNKNKQALADNGVGVVLRRLGHWAQVSPIPQRGCGHTYKDKTQTQNKTTAGKASRPSILVRACMVSVKGYYPSISLSLVSLAFPACPIFLARLSRIPGRPVSCLSLPLVLPIPLSGVPL
uniref:Uncharacterized protein n=1 Tax=Paramormyrops kingsleyae TaxID=1676925 RepID=A0A3B3RW85_9TELE